MRISDWSSDVCSSDLPLNGLQVWQGGENVAIGQADAGRDEIKRLNMLDTDALRSEVCFQCASNGSGINHRRPSRGADMAAIWKISGVPALPTSAPPRWEKNVR